MLGQSLLKQVLPLLTQREYSDGGYKVKLTRIIKFLVMHTIKLMYATVIFILRWRQTRLQKS